SAPDYYVYSICPPTYMSLSLHASLPICRRWLCCKRRNGGVPAGRSALFPAADADCTEATPGGQRFHDRRCALQRSRVVPAATRSDRKSTRLNSSHVKSAYADVCLSNSTT